MKRNVVRAIPVLFLVIATGCRRSDDNSSSNISQNCVPWPSDHKQVKKGLKESSWIFSDYYLENAVANERLSPGTPVVQLKSLPSGPSVKAGSIQANPGACSGFSFDKTKTAMMVRDDGAVASIPIFSDYNLSNQMTVSRSSSQSVTSVFSNAGVPMQVPAYVGRGIPVNRELTKSVKLPNGQEKCVMRVSVGPGSTLTGHVGWVDASGLGDPDGALIIGDSSPKTTGVPTAFIEYPSGNSRGQAWIALGNLEDRPPKCSTASTAAAGVAAAAAKMVQDSQSSETKSSDIMACNKEAFRQCAIEYRKQKPYKSPLNVDACARQACGANIPMSQKDAACNIPKIRHSIAVDWLDDGWSGWSEDPAVRTIKRISTPEEGLCTDFYLGQSEAPPIVGVAKCVLGVGVGIAWDTPVGLFQSVGWLANMAGQGLTNPGKVADGLMWAAVNLNPIGLAWNTYKSADFWINHQEDAGRMAEALVDTSDVIMSYAEGGWDQWSNLSFEERSWQGCRVIGQVLVMLPAVQNAIGNGVAVVAKGINTIAPNQVAVANSAIEKVIGVAKPLFNYKGFKIHHWEDEGARTSSILKDAGLPNIMSGGGSINTAVYNAASGAKPIEQVTMVIKDANGVKHTILDMQKLIEGTPFERGVLRNLAMNFDDSLEIIYALPSNGPGKGKMFVALSQKARTVEGYTNGTKFHHPNVLQAAWKASGGQVMAKDAEVAAAGNMLLEAPRGGGLFNIKGWDFNSGHTRPAFEVVSSDVRRLTKVNFWPGTTVFDRGGVPYNDWAGKGVPGFVNPNILNQNNNGN